MAVYPAMLVETGYAPHVFDIGAHDEAGENTVFVQSTVFEWQFTDSSSYILNSSYIRGKRGDRRKHGLLVRVRQLPGS